jgi:Mg2+-importing ATPase
MGGVHAERTRRPVAPALPATAAEAFWSGPAEALLAGLGTSPAGLTTAEAEERLERYGSAQLGGARRTHAAWLLARQFTSPLVLILTMAALLSFALHDVTDAVIILAIVLISGMLGFWQEYGAHAAVEKLLALVEVRATVLRDGAAADVPVAEVVPGDVVLLAGGDSVPADCRLLESRDLFVDEAALTGESYPAEKQPGDLAPDTPLAKRTNALFLGTHVVSGSGRAVAVRTGRATAFGAISARLAASPPETEFEQGVRRFGYLLMEITLLLVFGIFAINVYLARPVLDSFLFALALAVGLTPQLLPAIISVNLARGARRMARDQVIVKRLAAIEDFGSMDVLCSDKTGTLTEGRIQVHAALDAAGDASERVGFFAFLNASYASGTKNPIDTAIREQYAFDLSAWQRLDEVPYDFLRRRLSVLAREGDGAVWLVMKGALTHVLEACSTVERGAGQSVPLAEAADEVHALYERLSAEGFRTLGVALRSMPRERTTASAADESGLTLLGVLALADPPKPRIAETLAALAGLGIALKVITGDNVLVATHVAREVGLAEPRVLSGGELARLSEAALPARAARTDVFAEIEPNQKERIIRALRAGGHVVGYMGDGINDAPALHAADVSISVQSAVDVAKEAADIVLLEQELGVLEAGVREGRRTFANTLKYVFMATSANFGNMFSMAGASLFLPFLPLLPKQILLLNLLTDVPELTIATDRVDPEALERPHRWNVAFIRRFMLVFGPLSSVFDYLTFAVLIGLLGAGTAEFRTGWFLESVVSATLVVLVIRTRRPFLRSRPSRPMLAATVLILALAIALPFTALGRIFGFVAVPALFLVLMGAIVLLYVAFAEVAKRLFFRRWQP